MKTDDAIGKTMPWKNSQGCAKQEGLTTEDRLNTQRKELNVRCSRTGFTIVMVILPNEKDWKDVDRREEERTQ